MELTSCEAFIKAINKKIELSKKNVVVNKTIVKNSKTLQAALSA